MWYFTWILGVLLVCFFAILNGMWHEFQYTNEGDPGDSASGR